MNERAIKESARRFGERRRLVGILTEPAQPERGRAVLVTAGLTPKFGPFRLYAQLARRLAADGWRVLRFDLGGIGDSRQSDAVLPLAERTRRELAAAVDLVGAGPGPLALAGLCSGAEDSVRYAEADPRVAALALVDPFAYRTPAWRRRDRLIRAARRALQAARLLPPPSRARAALVDYQHMSRQDCVRRLRALVAREVSLHFVYTGGMRESFNHKAQFDAMFSDVDFRGLATVDYFPQLRHTQVLEADRRLVVDSIARALGALPTPCPR